MDSRPATAADAAHVTRCIELAFAADPIWEPALRRRDRSTSHHGPYWRLFVEGALRYGTVYISGDGGAVSVWLPPGGTELTADQEERLETLLTESLDPHQRDAIFELYERFGTCRGPHPEHYYLSLLATHPDHRGRGVGQALLASDLARWDAERVPTYLESSNPLNNHRYERAGYRALGGFSAVLDDTWVTAMWRDVGGH
jgi:GNAT superfamily N-acetyltransferase